jgi:co-chaperonin GroES (HSP10)
MVATPVRAIPVEPNKGFLVCERIKETMTKGGLALPDSAMAAEDAYKPMKLRVLAVGPPKINDRTGEPVEYYAKVGDIVIPAGPGFKWDFDGWELWLLDDEMVVAKMVPHAQQEP